jgi:hypothetical protein
MLDHDALSFSWVVMEYTLLNANVVANAVVSFFGVKTQPF